MSAYERHGVFPVSGVRDRGYVPCGTWVWGFRRCDPLVSSHQAGNARLDGRFLGRPQLSEHASHGRALFPPEDERSPGNDDAEPEQQARAVRPGQPDEDEQRNPYPDERPPTDQARTAVKMTSFADVWRKWCHRDRPDERNVDWASVRECSLSNATSEPALDLR